MARVGRLSLAMGVLPTDLLDLDDGWLELLLQLAEHRK